MKENPDDRNNKGTGNKGKEEIDMPNFEQIEHAKGGKHHQLSMNEIYNSHHAEDKGYPEGCQYINQTHDDACNEYLRE